MAITRGEDMNNSIKRLIEVASRDGDKYDTHPLLTFQITDIRQCLYYRVDGDSVGDAIEKLIAELTEDYIDDNPDYTDDDLVALYDDTLSQVNNEFYVSAFINGHEINLTSLLNQ